MSISVLFRWHNIDIISAVRMQWAKSYARATRWREEVRIAQHEMERVVASFRWESVQWRARVPDDVLGSDTLHDGLKAYALEQAALYDKLVVKFGGYWIPVLLQGKAALEAAGGELAHLGAMLSAHCVSGLLNTDSIELVNFEDDGNVTDDDD